MQNDVSQAADVSVSPGRALISGSRPARRDRYADVGAATRASYTAARTADPPLTATAWAVLSVIHEELTTYSRLSARLTHPVIASRAQVDRYHLRRVIQRLVEVGAVSYSAGRGPRHSVFSLPSPDGNRADGTRGEHPFEPRALDEGFNRANGTRASTARPGRADITRSSSEESVRGELLTPCDDGVVAEVSTNGKPPRPRDELFDALIEVVGWDMSELTKAGRGKINAALKELRDVGATAVEIRIRAQRFRRIHQGATLTPNALAAWWPGLSQAASPVAETGGSALYRPAHEVLAEMERDQ